MCGRKFLTGLLLLAGLHWPLFSLSPEDAAFRARIQDLSREKLIEIAVTQHSSLRQIDEETTNQEEIWNEIESLHRKREIILNERENSLTRRENRLKESEASLIMREQLLTESWEIQEQMMKDKFWGGFKWGSIAGIVVGGAAGYGASQLK